MKASEMECVTWCPKCKDDKFKVLRMPTSTEGVFRHERRPMKVPEPVSGLHCDDCGTLLERKPDDIR
jgi:hypothetical protein